MKLFCCCFLFATFLGAVYAQDGRQIDFDFYIPSARDTYLSKFSPDHQAGTEETIGVRLAGSHTTHGLVFFDYRSITETATRPVVEASLRFHINFQGGGGVVDTTGRVLQLSFHRMLTEWDESTATWNSLALEEGVDYETTPITTLDVPGGQTREFVATGFANAVQSWSTGDWANYGILIKANPVNGQAHYETLSFRSRDFVKVWDHHNQMQVRLLGTSPYPLQGAVVNESLATQTLHVSPTGNDTNDGTVSAPLQTINAALAQAATRQTNFLGTKILIENGIYRENLDALENHQTPAGCYNPIILEAANHRQVVISGAEQWTNWAPTSTSGIFTAPWPYDWGNVVPIPAGGTAYEQEWVQDHPLLRRREMIYVEGELYRQVLNQTDLESIPGSFYADETNDELSIHFSAGHTPSSNVEVSERSTCMVAGKTNHLVLRGLVFQHGGSVLLDKGAVRLTRCSELLIENCDFINHNGNGLSVSGEDATIDGFPVLYPCRNLTFRDVAWDENGIGGIETYGNENVLVEDCQSCYNNWRGNWEGFRFGWVTSRFYRCHNAIIRNLKANHNEARGWWMDYDNRDILVEDSEFNNNLTNGLKFEVCVGPFTFRRCHFEDNGEDGITVTNSGNITLEDCFLHRNGNAQITVIPLDGHFLRDWETGVSTTAYSENWNVSGCSFETELDQKFWSVPDNTAAYPFVSSLTANRNLYAYQYESASFKTDVTPASLYEFAAWQSLTSQDGDSQAYALNTLGTPSTINLTLDQDSTFSETSPDSALGTNTHLSQTIYGAKNYSFMRFNLSGLTGFNVAESAITLANLEFYVNAMHHSGNTNVADQSHRIYLHRLYQPWTETDTWNSIGITPGRTYDPTPLATYTVEGADGFGIRSLPGLQTALVKWQTGEWENHGVILVSAPTSSPFSSLAFNSREHANDPPALQVESNDKTPTNAFADWAQDHYTVREFTDPAKDFSTEDVDGDGLSVWDEYAFSLDPLDEADSTVNLTISTPNTNELEIRFRSRSGTVTQVGTNHFQVDQASYILESSFDQTNWSESNLDWQYKGTSTDASGQWIIVTTELGADSPNRAYTRIRHLVQ